MMAFMKIYLSRDVSMVAEPIFFKKINLKIERTKLKKKKISI